MKGIALILAIAGAAIAGGTVGCSADQAAASAAEQGPWEDYQQPASGPWEDYQRAPAAGDDQIARINADLARDRQVEDDAKVQAKAIAAELRK